MHARALVVLVIALAGLFGGSSSAGSPASDSAAAAGQATASLRIALWSEGKEGGATARRWTLRCGPVSGTLPARKRACRRLLALERPFRPVPRGAVCTQIYGGPQVAEVRGSLRGAPVATTFRRTDGCQIDRWDRHRFLFPGSVSS